MNENKERKVQRTNLPLAKQIQRLIRHHPLSMTIPFGSSLHNFVWLFTNLHKLKCVEKTQRQSNFDLTYTNNFCFFQPSFSRVKIFYTFPSVDGFASYVPNRNRRQGVNCFKLWTIKYIFL